ncbi:hypothetical protein NH340_JMT00949 [Sarcoptes scabiei]|nr:hypothetical protein NH340_JMT00949 [Sarcoptes scabiei]
MPREKRDPNGSSSDSTSLANKQNQLPTIRSRYRHVQINLPLTEEKHLYFHRKLIDNERCRRIEKCVDLFAKVLSNYDPLIDKYRLINETIINAPLVETDIYRISIAWVQNERLYETSFNSSELFLEFFQCNQTGDRLDWLHNCQIYSVLESLSIASNWISSKLIKIFKLTRQYDLVESSTSEWSNLFYDCHDHRWFISYHSLIIQSIQNDGYHQDSTISTISSIKSGENFSNNQTKFDSINEQQYSTRQSMRGDQPTASDWKVDDVGTSERDEISHWFRVKGVISVDIDVTETDINQCGERNFYKQTIKAEPNHSENFVSKSSPPSSINEVGTSRTTLQLFGTHKCHKENSECIFLPGHGMFHGGYQCQCKIGYHSTVANLGPTFNGSLMERSYQDKLDGKNPAYDYMFNCERCQPGCEQCQDNSPCLSTYNWAFRISLLTITSLCIIFIFILALNIYRYRRLKVIKVASPIFLCITLLGCASMYLETIVIFPVTNTITCVLTKWTRNFGFCLTYSSLLLKTWRVSLTYRVKSAHKIKLTDKQLLQWLFPILLVMAIYLGSWTISDTPKPFYIIDWNNLKFKQCDYNWWDHSLCIGEFFFLLWGIKVCYNVRNAESLFDEAKYITWAIYNITMVNMVMILIHLFILPNCGPDIEYFFGFLRTQLSTTTTVVLIFGPKFYRVIKGEGDLWNPRFQTKEAMSESFTFNGASLPQEETTTDLYQENDDLKRELQKLATQLEIMKLCQMEFRNRHLTNHSKFSRIQQQQHQHHHQQQHSQSD